jgi:hypothetical protein
MRESNPRARKLDAISTKIAMFTVEETFNDEPLAQEFLSIAIQNLDKAKEILKANDERIAGGG